MKVIIIGAGPAGLTAGYELLKSEKETEVIIIEKENDVGGISKTLKFSDAKFDIGGHRYFSKNQTINELWNEILNDDILIRDRKSQILYKENLFDYPIKINFSSLKKLGLYESLKIINSYVVSVFINKKKNLKNLEQFYISSFGKRLYEIFFKDYTEKLWGRSAKNIDSSWGAQRVKGLSILTIVKELFRKKDEQTKFKYPINGSGMLWDEVEKKIIACGGTIIKNANVCEISLNANNIVDKITYITYNELKEITGNFKVISSMPLDDLLYSIDRAPANIKEMAAGLPFRNFIIVVMLIKKNCIATKKGKELLKNHWVYIQDKDINCGRIQVFNNWSDKLVDKDYFLIGMEYFCSTNDNLWNMSNNDLFELSSHELKKMKIIENDSHVQKFYCFKQEKAYPAYWSSYSYINELENYLLSIENLYCIGRNGQHKYNNIDHSMLTAIEAVQTILNNKKDKSNIWKVNTNNDYNG